MPSSLGRGGAFGFFTAAGKTFASGEPKGLGKGSTLITVIF